MVSNLIIDTEVSDAMAYLHEQGVCFLTRACMRKYVCLEVCVAVLVS